MDRVLSLIDQNSYENRLSSYLPSDKNDTQKINARCHKSVDNRVSSLKEIPISPISLVKDVPHIKKYQFYSNAKGNLSSGMLPKVKDMVLKNYTGRGEMKKSFSMKNLGGQQKPSLTEIVVEKPKELNYLEKIREMALNTIIDKEEETSILIEKKQEKSADVSTIDLTKTIDSKTSLDNFAAKSCKNFRIKEIQCAYPSSLNYIPSSIKSLTDNPKKRYILKPKTLLSSESSNIFSNIKSKQDIFHDIIENQSSQSNLKNLSKKTFSTQFTDDSRYYMNDKTKKCVRALNDFNDLTKDVKGFVGN